MGSLLPWVFLSKKQQLASQFIELLKCIRHVLYKELFHSFFHIIPKTTPCHRDSNLHPF